MGITRRYRGLPEQNLASYDFYDLATGTGYKTFLGIDTNTGAATKVYRLITNAYYPASGYTGYAAAIDVDFDLALEVPMTIDGNLFFNVVYGYDGAAADRTANVKFYHVNAAGTETQIGASWSLTIGGADTANTITSGLANIPLTRFKAGETFRMSITADDAAATVRIYSDPMNRTSLGGHTLTTSQLKVLLPIKL